MLNASQQFQHLLARVLQRAGAGDACWFVGVFRFLGFAGRAVEEDDPVDAAGKMFDHVEMPTRFLQIFITLPTGAVENLFAHREDGEQTGYRRQATGDRGRGGYNDRY